MAQGGATNPDTGVSYESWPESLLLRLPAAVPGTLLSVALELGPLHPHGSLGWGSWLLA